jgi:hypothetical protein
MDADGDGHLTRDEWDAHFEGLTKDKGHLTPDDLRLALFPPVPPRGNKAKGAKNADVMLRAFLDGDAGSPFEGPRPGQAAPDFTLPTQDGAAKITLSQFREKKPVVLIFGSFT